ncbi:helix-turn-helix domain-containing protein [Paenibacillus timonensis]|uniref:Helix-turn-helix domain-containing protein n=1 Tax=Paenibacillus timonensis TaxID=225915 RepID=A0ABW3SGV3_9BACL|nr:helix-turn-helix domain-containing protein [Paenibacillus timonensis]MCH1642742.1 helix-turn-helix domain-containing protein [Paenibacillus timonensis]
MSEQSVPLPEDTKHLLTSMFQQYPDVVNIPQLCEMLGGISSKSAYKLLQANRIPHFKIGRAYKIPKNQIIAYLQSLMHSQQIDTTIDFNTLTH